MVERPILFSAPMVRALLAGAKTQTRRIVKWKLREKGLNIGFTGLEAGCYSCNNQASGWVLRSRDGNACWNDRTWPARCPYGLPGDRLWVRETFSHITGNGIRVHYRADGEPKDRDGNVLPTEPGLRRWSSAIHMPRSISRILLEVTEVRVQRLHEISEQDAEAEGVEPFFTRFPEIGRDQRLTTGELARDAEHRASFAVLWDEINGKQRQMIDDDGEPVLDDDERPIMVAPSLWSANPWVWAITFKPVEA